jgi:hypothetical protein
MDIICRCTAAFFVRMRQEAVSTSTALEMFKAFMDMLEMASNNWNYGIHS